MLCVRHPRVQLLQEGRQRHREVSSASACGPHSAAAAQSLPDTRPWPVGCAFAPRAGPRGRVRTKPDPCPGGRELVVQVGGSAAVHPAAFAVDHPQTLTLGRLLQPIHAACRLCNSCHCRRYRPRSGRFVD